VMTDDVGDNFLVMFDVDFKEAKPLHFGQAAEAGVRVEFVIACDLAVDDSEALNKICVAFNVVGQVHKIRHLRQDGFGRFCNSARNDSGLQHVQNALAGWDDFSGVGGEAVTGQNQNSFCIDGKCVFDVLTDGPGGDFIVFFAGVFTARFKQ